MRISEIRIKFYCFAIRAKMGHVLYMLTPPHALLNARLAVKDGAGWQAALWVRNLTDIHYVTEAYQVVSGGYAGLVYNLPRTYGISLSRSF